MKLQKNLTHNQEKNQLTEPEITEITELAIRHLKSYMNIIKSLQLNMNILIKMEDMWKNEIQLLEMKNTIYEKNFKSL